MGRDDYKSGDKSFTAQITKLKASAQKPDVPYIAAMPDDIGLVVKQMRQAGVTQPIVGGDGYDTPLLLSVGGKAANDVYYSTHAFMAPTGSTATIAKFYTEVTPQRPPCPRPCGSMLSTGARRASAPVRCRFQPPHG